MANSFGKLVAVFQLIATGFALTTRPQEKHVQNHVLISECRATLHVSEWARIEYQFGEDYQQDELCTWIIRVDGASSLSFDLEWDETVDLTTRLTVAAVDALNGGWPYFTEMTYESLNPNVGQTQVTLSGSIAVVVFQSVEAVGRGFALNVTTASTTDHIFSPNSVDQIFRGNGKYSYPENGESYTQNELSTLMIGPAFQNSSRYCYGSCTTLRYTERSIESMCNDRLDVYSYSHWTTKGWRHHRQICRGEGPILFVEAGMGELILVLFASDYSDQYEGFDLEFTAYQGLNVVDHALKNNAKAKRVARFD